VWKDDAQVVSFDRVSKDYPSAAMPSPGVRIWISPTEDES
jgi:Holliday junction resolvase RusA-like endonuclease